MDSEAAKPSTRRVDRPDPARVAAARSRLWQGGQTIEAWAAANDEPAATVRKVLSGTRACRSGVAHRVAVKLGIVDRAHVA